MRDTSYASVYAPAPPDIGDISNACTSYGIFQPILTVAPALIYTYPVSVQVTGIYAEYFPSAIGYATTCVTSDAVLCVLDSEGAIYILDVVWNVLSAI